MGSDHRAAVAASMLAKRAQQVAERACEALSERRSSWGPIQASPSIRAAINSGPHYLTVEWSACQQTGAQRNPVEDRVASNCPLPELT